MAETGQLAIDPWACLWRVRREHGKSIASQLFELARLGLDDPGLSPAEYYRYRLYDDARYAWDDKRRFLSDTRRDLGERTCNPRWGALTDDKLLAAALLGHHGVPVPRIRAVLHPTRTFPGAARLTTADELSRFLRESDAYPLFAKPAGGGKSRGTAWLVGFDAASDRLLRHAADPVPVETFAASLVGVLRESAAGFRAGRNALGYMLQDLVRQHPAIVRRCGESVCGVRAYTGLDASGPRLFEAVWKLAAPGSPADNFWRPGNLLAALDPKSGEVMRVVQGAGPDQLELEANPHTGQRLVGFRLPHFEALTDLVLRGATLYPEVRLLAWDVAIGPDGPIVLEANRVGALVLAQLATGRGLASDAFRAFVRRAEAENPARPRGLRRMHRTRHLLRRLGKLAGLRRRSGG